METLPTKPVRCWPATAESHTMKLRDLNPFAPPPGVQTLASEELEEIKRQCYLEDRRADHHRENAEALARRISKLETMLRGES